MSDDNPTPTDRLDAFINASLEAWQSPQSTVDTTLPFIVFLHGKRWFGVRAESVSIVVTRESITRVPRQPDHILGVALIRSRLVPVIDLAKLLEMSERSDAAIGARLVVLTSDEAELAIIADEAHGVVQLRPDAMSHSRSTRHEFVSSEINWNRKMVSIIDTLSLIAAATRREGVP